MNRRLTGIDPGLVTGTAARPWLGWLPSFNPDDAAGGGSDAGDSDSDDDSDDDDASGGDANDPDARVRDAEDKAAKARQEAGKRRQELRPWKQLAQDTGLTPEQIRERLTAKPAGNGGSDGGQPVDVDGIRREAERAATEKANARVVRAEVKALAADLFADPTDAPLYLDLSRYEVGADGSLDEDEIRDDLRDVLSRKPHLGKRGDGQQSAGESGGDGKRTPRTPAPDPSQGAKGAAGVKGGLSAGADRYRRQAEAARAATAPMNTST